MPADGDIACGSTEVDESLLTGESLPRVRQAGGRTHRRHAQSHRRRRDDGDARRSGLDARGGIAAARARAASSRPAVADLADRVAAWFVAGVLLLAAAVALYWLHADAARAFATVLAVLVVTCPCALSLATPAALAAATTRLARAALLVTRGRALESLARADRIVFDKTGTLTRGEPRLESAVLEPAPGAVACVSPPRSSATRAIPWRAPSRICRTAAAA